MKKSYLSLGRFRLGARFVVPITSLVMGLQYGLSHGIGNHNTYLLPGLKLFKPELFVNDWLVSQTTAYHPTFAYLVNILYHVSADGWAIGFANVLTIAASVWFIYGIVAQVFDDAEYRLPVFLLVAAFLSTTETYSVSGSYIFSRTFQPSSIAALSFLAGMRYFLRRQWVISGVILAVGGLFHVNFLLLSMILFGLVHPAMGRSGLFKRLFHHLGFCVVALVPMLPMLISAGLSPDAASGRELYQRVNAPQHYLPLTYLTEFVPLILWLVLSIVIGYPILSQGKLKREFLLTYWISISLVGAATLLTTIVFIPAVSQMYFWRLAPYCVLFALIITSGGFVQRLKEPDFKLSPLSVLGIAIVIIGMLGIWYYHYGWYRQLNINLLMLAGLVWIVSILFKSVFSMNRRRIVAGLTALVIGLFGVVLPLRDFERKSSLLTGFVPDEQALIDWTRGQTDVDAVFLIPPMLNNFRLNAQRAVVVDTKSPPVIGHELLEWYRRLEDVSGAEGFRDKSVLTPGYKSIDKKRLEILSERYRFQYAVLYRESVNDSLSDSEVVYENPTWAVLSVR